MARYTLTESLAREVRRDVTTHVYPACMCRQYAGVFDAMTSIYKDGGINALFVGSAARYAPTPLFC